MIADKSELDKVVEAILFVAGNGVELKDIAEKLEVDVKDIKQSVENLKEKHKDDGFNIITYKGSAQFSSNPIYVEDVATVLNPIREKQLTKAALETLGIIAYKQPVTKLDIEQVRGVNSDYAVQVLTSFKLIEVVGRKDAVGKPLLYGTTDEFLKRFDLQNINDLPDYEELLSRIKVLHETSDSLYKSDEIIPEEDLPDSVARREEQESVESKNLENEAKQEKEIVDQEKTNQDTSDSAKTERSSSIKENLQNVVANSADFVNEKSTLDVQMDKILSEASDNKENFKNTDDTINENKEELKSTDDTINEKDLKDVLTKAYEEQEVWTTKDNDLL